MWGDDFEKEGQKVAHKKQLLSQAWDGLFTVFISLGVLHCGQCLSLLGKYFSYCLEKVCS